MEGAKRFYHLCPEQARGSDGGCERYPCVDSRRELATILNGEPFLKRHGRLYLISDEQLNFVPLPQQRLRKLRATVHVIISQSLDLGELGLKLFCQNQ